jgi:phage gp45-like
MLTTEQLNRLQNFGFTSQGAAIVDAIWFASFGSDNSRR